MGPILHDGIHPQTSAVPSRRDQLVDVFMSRRGKAYFAQIIQLCAERSLK
jgi:hypothetical protein